MNIASKVRHPNLLQFLGATQEGNSYIILCELMKTSLHDLLLLESNKNYLMLSQIIKISQDVLCALNYLHLQKPHPILHRDVSSPNVLLEPSVTGWKAKLSDYGSANLANKISPKSAHPGNQIYSAPEAYSPDKHSPAMDVYSFGVLLMEMILCKIPSSSAKEREQQAEAIPWISSKIIVRKCINHESTSRPSIAEVIDEINRIKD
jgi:serine/threonine protein kinase